MKFADVKPLIDTINDHYSMIEAQHKILFDYAMKVPKGGLILEIGVCNGKTAAMFGLIAKERNLSYIGIDDFSLESSKAEVDAHFERLGAKGSIIESRTQDIDWHTPIDLLFIDGGHDEANVSVDCEKFVPFVKVGGVVIFDDWALDETKVDPHWAVGHYGTIATQGWKSLDDQTFIRSFRRTK